MPSVSVHKILIPEPEAGSYLHLTILPDQVYLLGFAPETATIVQDGRDVRVLCENGGRIVLQDFFPAVAQGDITLELQDGTLISGQALAEVLAMSLRDFRTDGQPDLVASAVDMAGASAQSGPAGTLCLGDVLDVSPPVLFECSPTRAGEAGHSGNAPAVGSGLASGTIVASHSVSSLAGTAVTDDAVMLLALQRMDM